jgi:inner membrane transporter RhtA
MAVTSMSCVQLGLALSVPLFSRLGPLGVVALRLAWAGVLLPVLVRPRPRDFTGRDLLGCGVLGGVTAGLMLLFMLAVARIPLGIASALEFLGPLAVSMFGAGGGRWRWTAPAAIGVVLLTSPWNGGISPAGLGFALAAALCWAAYILLTQHVGDHVTGLSGLAISMPVAGVIAVLTAGRYELDRVTWPLLVTMLAMAVLHPVLPFSLEFLALRRLTTSAFGILMSLEPAIALLAGLLMLRQIPSTASAAGILFVVIAGIGATRTGARAASSETTATAQSLQSPAEKEGNDHHGRPGEQGDRVGDHEGNHPGRRAVGDPQDESDEQNREVAERHLLRGPLAQHAADLQHRCYAHQHGPRGCGNCQSGLCHGVPPVRRPGCSDRARQLPGEGRKHDHGHDIAARREWRF